MDRNSATRLIKDTFENSFDKECFRYFIKNLLNRIDESKAFHARGYVQEMYRHRIRTYERLGAYTDPEGNRIDVLIVYLQKDTTLDQGRTSQRNFLASYLKNRGEKDAGLIAFVAPNQEDWRFSLVKMEYRFVETENGTFKAKEEFTPARRFSFLVGKHEKSHTAQSKLVPILEDDQNIPTLENLEEAFNIERVTKEFFKKYRELFVRTKDELDKVVSKQSRVKADFEAKDVDSVNFAKKLLGQIVFLYFLQKKGWFGVKRDAVWGTGSKHFLRELFEGKHGKYNNFFNDILEPLFYEALRIGEERKQDDYYYSRFNCKIPFLNGGLFDPIGNYDWVHTDIHLPNDLFSNRTKTKEGDIGNGILDIFDRYNFTVKEDEPLEKEVAIDPELLGKAYEKFNAIRSDNYEDYKNALKSGKKGAENKFNRQYGVYYTPREIVHYMCQQSLIYYLHTELNQKTSSYEKIGDQQKDMIGEQGKKGQMDLSVKHTTGAEIPKGDIETLIKFGEQVGENEATVVAKGKETDTYYHKIPESVRQNVELIDTKLANIKICDPAVGSGAFLVGIMSEIVKARNVLSAYIKKPNRTVYDFKHQCIEKSLYGADIDPGAVEITKLRLWLSLVVDEEDIKRIKPLPNLDYKIVCGNSLLGVERRLENDRFFVELEHLKPLLFNETNPTKKKEYKNQIEGLISKITDGHKEFDFEVYFSEVFHGKKGGFDVVIGNPPYVRQEEISHKPALKNEYEIFNSVSDLYTYFYEKGFKLLKDFGALTFITSNKFTRAKYGVSLRKYLKVNTTVKSIINFGDKHIFEAITNTLIFIATKEKTENNILNYSDEIETPDKIRFSQSDLQGSEWTIERPEVIHLKKKIELTGTLVKDWDVRINRGLLTGYNNAFIIDDTTRNDLIRKDPKSKEIIKPIIRGRDIKRYHYVNSGQYLIVPHNGYRSTNNEEVKAIKINEYTSIKNHLDKYIRHLKERQDKGVTIYNLRDCAFMDDFAKEKIIWIELTNENKFAYSDKEDYLLAGAFFLVGKSLKYLLSFLNSKLCHFYFSLICNSSGMATIQWKKFALEKMPIMELAEKDQKPFIDLVDKILAITKDEDYLQNPDKQAKVKRFEREIDELVYKLYGLTPDEVAIIEEQSVRHS